MNVTHSTFTTVFGIRKSSGVGITSKYQRDRSEGFPRRKVL